MDSEGIVVEVTSAQQIIQLNGPMMHDRFRVRWVQVIGANFPVDTVFIITMGTEDVMNIGMGITSNLTSSPHRAIVVPLTAATSTYTFNNTMPVLDRTVHGQSRMRGSNAKTLAVSILSNVTNPPTFTRVVIYLEAF